VVRPLRTARRALKTAQTPFDAAAIRLREEIKRSELAAEKIQQLTIERLFPATTFGWAASSQNDAIEASLAAYNTSIGTLPDAATQTLINLFKQHKS
jgi:hypothetical protein